MNDKSFEFLSNPMPHAIDVLAWVSTVTEIRWLPGLDQVLPVHDNKSSQYVLLSQRYFIAAAIDLEEFRIATEVGSEYDVKQNDHGLGALDYKIAALKMLRMKSLAHAKIAQKPQVKIESRIRAANVADFIDDRFIREYEEYILDAKQPTQTILLDQLGRLLSTSAYAKQGFKPERSLEIVYTINRLLNTYEASSHILFESLGYAITSTITPPILSNHDTNEETYSPATVWKEVRPTFKTLLSEDNKIGCTPTLIGLFFNLISSLPEAEIPSTLDLLLTAIKRWKLDARENNLGYACQQVIEFCKKLNTQEIFSNHIDQGKKILEELIGQAKKGPGRIELLKLMISTGDYPATTNLDNVKPILSNTILQDLFGLIVDALREDITSTNTPWLIIGLRLIADQLGDEYIKQAWRLAAKSDEIVYAYWLEEIASQAPGTWTHSQLTTHLMCLADAYRSLNNTKASKTDNRLRRTVGALFASANMLDNIIEAGDLVEQFIAYEIYDYQAICTAITMIAPGISSRSPDLLIRWAEVIECDIKRICSEAEQNRGNHDEVLAASIALHTLAIEYGKIDVSKADYYFDMIQSIVKRNL